MFIKDKSLRRREARRALGLAAAALVLVALWWVLGPMDARAAGEGAKITAESLRRAAVQCYALEGRYPPDLSYLKEHYGVVPDEERYAVYYTLFASNLMPEIDVLIRADE